MGTPNDKLIKDTLEEEWQEFRKMTINKDAGEIQLRESRRIFFSGAFIMMKKQVALVSDRAIPEFMMVKTLDKWDKEITETLLAIAKEKQEPKKD